MGGVGVSLRVSGDGDRAELHDAIWNRFLGRLHYYNAKPWTSTTDYYLGEAMHDAQADGSWGVDGDDLGWMFRDYAGCCSRAARLWVHWMEGYFAADWDILRNVAQQRGFTIVTQRPSLDAFLTGNRDAFMRFRQDWWSVNEEGLNGDDQFVPLTELTEAQQTKHAEAMRRCLCGLCRELRRRRQRDERRAAARV